MTGREWARELALDIGLIALAGLALWYALSGGEAEEAGVEFGVHIDSRGEGE